MKPIVAIIHATRNAIQPINEVFTTHLRNVELLNFLDEAMLWITQKRGVDDPEVIQRMENILLSAEKIGAWLIVSSCTSLSPAFDQARHRIRTPVLKIEEALTEEIAEKFLNIRAVVTSTTTIEPIRDLLQRKADAKGKRLEIRFHYCEGAFQALSDNQPDLHDQIVLDAISSNAMTKPDAIMLPQVSIARIIGKVPDDIGIPILSSVHVSVNRVREFIEQKIQSMRSK